MNIAKTPVGLMEQCQTDELLEIAALPRCQCVPSVLMRIAVRENYSASHYIYRCQCCQCLVPADEVAAGTCDVRPAVVS